MNAATVVGEYHRRRFMPLMARTLPMWRLGPNDRVVGDTVMASEVLSDTETAKCVRAAVRLGAPAWPVGYAPMKPHSGHL